MRQLARTVTDQNPFQVAFERVQTVTGKVHLLRRSCIVEYGQYFLNRVHQIRAYPAAVVTFKEAFQAAMPEASNHQNTP